MKDINEVYEILTYGEIGGFKKAQQRWLGFRFLMDIKKRTGVHLLASDGQPLIEKLYGKEPNQLSTKKGGKI